MIKKFIGVMLLAIIAFSLVVVSQPSHFSISRSATFTSSPSLLFSEINDFHRWQAWSPWAKIDPNAKIAYSGAESGVGAEFRWNGNDEVGEGQMKIVNSQLDQKIDIELKFTRPFSATNLTEFLFEPSGNGTKVTWSMSGNNNFIAKAVGLFLDCDKMVGGQFEQGFANLKNLLTPPNN